jgi:hypothetical protein
MLVLLALLFSVAQFVCINASPTIQLGGTTLAGREIAPFQQEFFGGPSYSFLSGSDRTAYGVI